MAYRRTCMCRWCKGPGDKLMWRRIRRLASKKELKKLVDEF